MMRNLDKVVLFAGAALAALVLLLEISSVVHLGGAFSRADDEVRALTERVNKNSLTPKERDPKEYSGRVFLAWETPARDAQQFSGADFFPLGR